MSNQTPAAQQQALLQAMLAQGSQQAQQAAPGRGGSTAARLSTALSANRAKKAEEAESRMLNRHYGQSLEQAGGDQELASIYALNAASNEMAARGHHTQSRKLRDLAIQRAAARQQTLLDQNKLQSEIAENKAQAANASYSSLPEVVKLQLERSDMRDLLTLHQPGTEPYERISGRIEEHSARIKKLTEITGRTGFDVGDVQDDLYALEDRYYRLQNIMNSFDPRLLEASSRLKVGGLQLLDQFGWTTDDQREYIQEWQTLASAAMEDLNVLLYERSGAAVTETEAKRMAAVLPTPGTAGNPFSGDSPTVFKRKLDNQMAWLKAAMRRKQMLIRQGVIQEGEAPTDAQVARFPLSDFLPTGTPLPGQDSAPTTPTTNAPPAASQGVSGGGLSEEQRARINNL